jgi:protein gp37
MTGCTPVSAGCDHCYAHAIYDRFHLDFTPRADYRKLYSLIGTEFAVEGNVRGPGTRPLAFVCDMGDLFHPDIPHKFIIEAFRIMAARGSVDWLVLTKRPERAGQVLFDFPTYYLGGDFHPVNIWLGVTVEAQYPLGRLRRRVRPLPPAL